MFSQSFKVGQMYKWVGPCPLCPPIMEHECFHLNRVVIWWQGAKDGEAEKKALRETEQKTDEGQGERFCRDEKKLFEVVQKQQVSYASVSRAGS